MQQVYEQICAHAQGAVFGYWYEDSYDNEFYSYDNDLPEDLYDEIVTDTKDRLYDKFVASGIVKYLCNTSNSLYIKVDLLLKAILEDINIHHKYYLSVIHHSKKFSKSINHQKLRLLESKYQSLRGKKQKKCSHQKQRDLKFKFEM